MNQIVLIALRRPLTFVVMSILIVVFGGLTVLDGGAPLPTRQILAEQARLRCSWAILRRAFKRDAAERDMRLVLRRLRARYAAFLARSPGQVRRDRRRLLDTLREIAAAR